jgi:Predicted Zn-dependent protease (DUF2268)
VASIDARKQSPARAVACAALLLVISSCRDATQGIRTEFVGAYPFTATERRVIARVAGDTAREARQHLPALAARITLRVQSGKEVIPELGATAIAGLGDWVLWTVDADRPEGVVKIAEAHLRGALFHEFHHLVRGAALPPHTLMDHVIFEGMATAFERDFAGASPPWGQYPDDVSAWVDELLMQPPSAGPADWIAKQREDGRRWVGMRAGTYLVDVAMKKLRRTSAELVSTPTEGILTQR